MEAEKPTKPSVIVDAIAKASDKKENIKNPTNIYEYKYKPNKATLPYDKNVFQNYFLMKPWIVVIGVNLLALICLVAIGFGISVAISGATPKIYGDYCTSASDCLADGNYICSNNKCSCSDTTYFTGYACITRYGYMAACQSNKQCLYDLSCIFDPTALQNYCKCPENRFWNTSGTTCVKKYGYNSTGCGSSTECANGTNLVCTGGACTCVYPKYWNGNQCDYVQTINGSCTLQEQCDSTKLLLCSFYNQTLYQCICNSTFYWSNYYDKCLARGINGAQCTDTLQCRNDYGLYCDTSSSPSTCICNTTFYWTGTTCAKRIQNNGACSASLLCDTTQGLTCQAGTCRCPTNYFFNGTACQYYMSDGISCNNNAFSTGCDTNKNLVCDATSKKCICNTYTYWDMISKTCVAQLLNGSSCIQTVQCRSDKGLFCDTTLGICSCAAGNYWSIASAVCTAKLQNGVGCSFTYQCLDYNNFICSGTCQCPANYFLLTATYCTSQYSFNAACTAAGQCLTSRGLTCTSGVCQCASAANYWDYTVSNCVTKLVYSASCLYQTMVYSYNSQCNDQSPQFLVCQETAFLTNTWTCTCPSNRYRSAANTCVLKLGYAVSGCSTTPDGNANGMCQDYFGLICWSNNSTCLCPATYYWDAAANICKEKLGYGSSCTYHSMCQDYAYLYCLPGGSGTCLCDTDRYYNTLYTACLPRASHDQYCGDGTQCALSTPGALTCNANAGHTCQCDNYRNPGSAFFWSVASQNCIMCPTNYYSGYGTSLGGYYNTITNRCYYVDDTNQKTYANARATCTATAGSNLMQISTTYEMALAALWAGSIRNYWVGGLLDGSNTFYYWEVSGSTAQTVLTNLWCSGQPDNGGCTFPTRCETYTVVQGNQGNCLNDMVSTATNNYICEYGN